MGFIRRHRLLGFRQFFLQAVAMVALSMVPAWGFLLDAGPAFAQTLPIFDAHIHYSRSDWDAFPPETALNTLKKGGVMRAFVSSTPDDGTLRLYEKAPKFIVPVLRPYRTREDMGSWFRDPAVLAYLKERVAKGKGIYRGIGEFHMEPGDAASDVFRQVVALAAKERLFLHAHVDEVAIAEIAGLNRDVCVLWAHAGMSAEPEVIGRLLDQYPNLWAELALRWDISHDGLKPEWRSLFLRHVDRFLVGTDTWMQSQWEMLPGILDGYRLWLKELPGDIPEKIAYKNAERLSKPGACARPQASRPYGPSRG
jgi:hypothetical protein